MMVQPRKGAEEELEDEEPAVMSMLVTFCVAASGLFVLCGFIVL
jgi:hypothetical protein